MNKFFLIFIALLSLFNGHAIAADNIDYPKNNSSIIYADEMKKFISEINRGRDFNPSYLREASYLTPIFTKIPFQNEFLSSENIYKLFPNRLPIKEVGETFENGAFKNHIAFADMSDMVVLKANAMKTSIATIHVYSCVAVIATNSVTKNIGMAHIPGGPVDAPLVYDKAYDPLSHQANYHKMNIPTLKNGLIDFLQEVADGNKQDTKIHLIGGYSNRYLILTLANLINELGYSIDVENIFHGKSSRSNEASSLFDDRVGSPFNIEVDKDGNVFLLHDLAIFRNYKDLFTFKVQYISMPDSLDAFNNNLINLEPNRRERVNQFSNLTLTVYRTNEIDKYTYDETLGVIDKENIKNPTIIEAAKDRPHLLAHLLEHGFESNILVDLLQVVIFKKNLRCATLLLNKGANPTLSSSSGISPLMSAQIMRNEEIKTLLTNYIK